MKKLIQEIKSLLKKEGVKRVNFKEPVIVLGEGVAEVIGVDTDGLLIKDHDAKEDTIAFKDVLNEYHLHIALDELKEALGKYKYVFLSIETRDGEREYTQDRVHRIDKEDSIDKFADEFVKTYFDDEDEESGEEDGGYYQLGGQVHCSVKKVMEISKEDYEVLKRYI